MPICIQNNHNKNSDLRCDARELHAFLQVGRDFSTWIKGRIEEYGFEEGEDYCIAWVGATFDSPDLGNQTLGKQRAIDSDATCTKQTPHRGGDRRSIDYSLTLGMAKELAMIENSEIGRRVRRYFIEREKQAMSLLEERAKRMLPLPGVKRSARDGINFKQLLILQDQGRHIAKWLDVATGDFERHELHCQLRQINEALGLPTPPLVVTPASLE